MNLSCSELAPSSLLYYEQVPRDARVLPKGARSLNSERDWSRAEYCALEMMTGKFVSLLSYEQVPQLVQTWTQKSHMYGQEGDWEQAERCARDARDFCKKANSHAGSQVGLAVTDLHLAEIYYETGRIELALGHCEQSRRIFDGQAVQQHNEAVATYALGVLHEPHFSGDSIKALRWYERASQEFKKAQAYWAQYRNRLYYIICQQMDQRIAEQSKGVLDMHPTPYRKQTRSTQLYFPETCTKGQPAYLSVQVQLERGHLPIHTTPQAEKKEPAKLFVFVTAQGFDVDKHWKVLSMPFDRDSERVEFKLFGRKNGWQLVEVELFHLADRVGYALVETQVLDVSISGQ